MLPEIFSVKRSIERRLADYSFLRDNYTPCAQAYLVWGYILDYTFGHVKNWRALWQLSDESCMQFKTLSPMVVEVSVEELLVEELSAKVAVLWSQEDITFPTTVDVPIFEIFPLKHQDIPLRTVRYIADMIDQCRFFFLKLWYPWDNLENFTLSDWCHKHLENRLKLQYAISDGVCDVVSSQHVKDLMNKALEVNDALKGFDEENDLTLDNKLSFVKNLMRKEDIKLQLGFFEDPELRDTMGMFTHEKYSLKKTSVGIVIPKTTITRASSFLQMIESHVTKKEEISIYNDVQKAVKWCQTVFLCPGRHELVKLGRLIGFDGALKGLGRADETIVISADRCPGRYDFLTSFNCSLFQNLTVERREGLQLTVAKGVMRVHGCFLRGLEDKLATGVVVLPGCRLELVDCELSGLGTGVLVKKGGTALIRRCCIRNCAEGIKLIEGSTATLESVEVNYCSKAGIVAQSSELGDDTSGSLSLLSATTPKNWLLSYTECSFNNNIVDALIEKESYEGI